MHAREKMKLEGHIPSTRSGYKSPAHSLLNLSSKSVRVPWFWQLTLTFVHIFKMRYGCRWKQIRCSIFMGPGEIYIFQHYAPHRFVMTLPALSKQPFPMCCIYVVYSSTTVKSKLSNRHMWKIEGFWSIDAHLERTFNPSGFLHKIMYQLTSYLLPMSYFWAWPHFDFNVLYV